MNWVELDACTSLEIHFMHVIPLSSVSSFTSLNLLLHVHVLFLLSASYIRLLLQILRGIVRTQCIQRLHSALQVDTGPACSFFLSFFCNETDNPLLYK
uniref:Uncharacterized protein n=1 Tax=Aegilops tauschii subsp. strangulata TaxID=200361 RepID=A0A453NAV6_AEGTS